MRRLLLLFALLSTGPLGAIPVVESVSPASGPAAGPVAFFGDLPAASTQVIDATTIVATTREHIPAGPVALNVTIGGQERAVMLQAGRDMFEPAYAVISNFPIGTGTARVTISYPPGSPNGLPPVEYPPVWAFVSVTNNDTQRITTITPQR